ncbi:MAG: hypothetical protein NTNFB02_16370 [Nitrospira sp.]
MGLIKDAQPNAFSADSRTDNRILGSLSQTDRRLLWASMELVSLAKGTIVETTDEPVAFAYFPVQAVLSLFGTVGDECKLEIAIILHRQELERRTCECYALLAKHIRDTPPALPGFEY